MGTIVVIVLLILIVGLAVLGVLPKILLASAIVWLLQQLDVLGESLTPRLTEYLVKPIRNTRNEIVGEVRPAAIG